WLDLAWPANDRGHAKAAVENGALGGLEWRHAAVRPGEYFRSIIGCENDDGIFGLANILQMLEQRADAIVHLGHARFFKAIIALGIHQRLILRREEGPHVHARRVVPDEEWLAVLLRLVHEALRMLHQNLVEGLHVVFGLAAFLPILAPGHVWE